MVDSFVAWNSFIETSAGVFSGKKNIKNEKHLSSATSNFFGILIESNMFKKLNRNFWATGRRIEWILSGIQSIRRIPFFLARCWPAQIVNELDPSPFLVGQKEPPMEWNRGI